MYSPEMGIVRRHMTDNWMNHSALERYGISRCHSVRPPKALAQVIHRKKCAMTSGEELWKYFSPHARTVHHTPNASDASNVLGVGRASSIGRAIVVVIIAFYGFHMLGCCAKSAGKNDIKIEERERYVTLVMGIFRKAFDDAAATTMVWVNEFALSVRVFEFRLNEFWNVQIPFRLPSMSNTIHSLACSMYREALKRGTYAEANIYDTKKRRISFFFPSNWELKRSISEAQAQIIIMKCAHQSDIWRFNMFELINICTKSTVSNEH